VPSGPSLQERERKRFVLTLPFFQDKWFAAQSLDNQILVYSTDGFRQNRKKRFAGHTVAGYACAVGFSPDGRFVSSGDGEGSMVFWDWRNGKIVKRLRAHKQVVIDHCWLPHESVSLWGWWWGFGRTGVPEADETGWIVFCVMQSKLITASWDGLIKLWD
jgi:pre-mRNA-processing factor 17